MTDDATRQSFCLMLAYLCIAPGRERDRFLTECGVRESHKKEEASGASD